MKILIVNLIRDCELSSAFIFYLINLFVPVTCIDLTAMQRFFGYIMTYLRAADISFKLFYFLDFQRSPKLKLLKRSIIFAYYFLAAHISFCNIVQVNMVQYNNTLCYSTRSTSHLNSRQSPGPAFQAHRTLMNLTFMTKYSL